MDRMILIFCLAFSFSAPAEKLPVMDSALSRCMNHLGQKPGDARSLRIIEVGPFLRFFSHLNLTQAVVILDAPLGPDQFEVFLQSWPTSTATDTQTHRIVLNKKEHDAFLVDGKTIDTVRATFETTEHVTPLPTVDANEVMPGQILQIHGHHYGIVTKTGRTDTGVTGQTQAKITYQLAEYPDFPSSGVQLNKFVLLTVGENLQFSLNDEIVEDVKLSGQADFTIQARNHLGSDMLELVNVFPLAVKPTSQPRSLHVSLSFLLQAANGQP